VRVLLEAARDQEASLYMSLINVGEVYYLMRRMKGQAEAEELLADLRTLPLMVCGVGEERVLAAAKLKADYAISYADAFAAALAQEFNAQLVTGDPEFRSVESLITVMWLPDR